MADRIELGRGQFIFENKFEISGKEELVKFIETLNSMTRKNNFAAYWKSQEELIRGVTKACEDFNKTQSNTDAKNLINSFNALKATADKDMNSLFSDYERIVSSFENAAKQMGTAVIGELSPANFRKAFESFEMLEAHGLEATEIFKRISSSADVDQLRKQIEDLTGSLARTTKQLESVRRERDNLLNGAEIERLKAVEEQYTELIYNMKREFASFLQANDLDPNETWGRFSHYFDQISNGSMTAKEAITAVRDEYAALIQYGEAGSTVFSSGQMQEFISKLENACTMIEQMRGEIQALTEGAALRQMTEEMAASETITERQREAISSLVAEGSGLSSVAQLLVELIKNFDATEHETNEAATAVKGLLETLKAIGEYGDARLGNLSKVFENLRYATQLNVDEKQFANLIGSLRDIGEITNLSSLQALTNISLAGFSDMHVSKASLSNLATYLPEIAKVNVDRLKELSAVNLSNFNNLSVKKATTDNLERLFNALAGKQDATATAETAAVGKEKAALGDVNELYKAHKAAVEAAVKAEAAKAETSNKLSGSLDREKKSTDDATKEAEKHTVALTKLRSLLDQVNAARAKTPGGFRNEADVESYSKLITSIHEVIEADEQQKWSAKDLEEEYKNLNLEYKEIHNAADERIRDAQRTADAARAEADAIKSEEDATRALARAGRELEDLKVKVGNLGLEENKQKMAELVSEAENLKTALETGGPENWSKNYKAFSDKLAEATHTVKQLSDEEKKADQERRKHSSTYEQINKLLQKSSDLELKYAHASGQDRDAIRNVTAELKTLREGFANGTVSQDQAAQSLERLKQTLSGVETNLRTSGTALQRWWTNGLTQLSSRLSYTFGMAAIVTKAVAEVRKMISTAVELDTAMNNLQIVTRGSNDDMAAYGKTVSQMAKETAQSTKDLIDATTVYARLGYTMDESATLAKFTAQLQNVGRRNCLTA